MHEGADAVYQTTTARGSDHRDRRGGVEDARCRGRRRSAMVVMMLMIRAMIVHRTSDQGHTWSRVIRAQSRRDVWSESWNIVVSRPRQRGSALIRSFSHDGKSSRDAAQRPYIEALKGSRDGAPTIDAYTRKFSILRRESSEVACAKSNSVRLPRIR